jgi:hypothetical protein
MFGATMTVRSDCIDSRITNYERTGSGPHLLSAGQRAHRARLGDESQRLVLQNADGARDLQSQAHSQDSMTLAD